MTKKEVLLNGFVVGEVEATGDFEKDAQIVRDFLREKGLDRDISIDDSMQGQANSFAEVANDLYRRDLKYSPYKGSSTAPFVVNAVLSIEIYLKTMHYLFGSTRHTHNLLDLYNRLDDDSKSIFVSAADDIRPRYRLPDGVDIIECLRSLSTAFEDWRYIYENKKLKTEIQSIRYTMHVSFEACCRAMETKNGV